MEGGRTVVLLPTSCSRGIVHCAQVGGAADARCSAHSESELGCHGDTRAWDVPLLFDVPSLLLQ